MISNDFGLALWRHAEPGNFAMSPASIASTLAMVWTGARGKTEQQMREVLRIDGDVERVAAEWGALVKRLRVVQSGLTLHLANRLFAQRGYPFEQAFLERLKHAFDAPLELVDFIEQAETARAQINAWVELQTENHIAQLLARRSVDGARLVLVNAIYFAGKWAAPFQDHQTQPRPFWISATQSKQVPTMRRTGTYRVGAVAGGEMIELPYRGDTTAMYIVVPSARDGLASLEQQLSPTLFATALGEERVELAMPRFRVAPETWNVNEALVALGMTLPFDLDRADFTGMEKTRDLRLSVVYHKAFVEADEEGTVAAAATAAMMVPRGAPPAPPRTFAIDRPFLFAIVDRESGLVLFLGRVVDP